MSSVAKMLHASLLAVGVCIPGLTPAAEKELGPEGQAAVSALADAIRSKKLNGILEVRKIRRLEAGAHAIPILIAGLDSADQELRRKVVGSLGRVRPATTDVISTLIALLADPDEEFREIVGEALVDVGPHAVPFLRRALRHEEIRIRLQAVRSLYSFGWRYAGVPDKEAADDLAAALQDRSPAIRRCAAYTLATMGPEAEQAVPSLIECLKDKDEDVRNAACEALGMIGPAAKPAIPEIRRLLMDDPEPTALGEEALGRIGSSAVHVLIELLSHENAQVRSEAARALARIGPKAKVAVPVLIKRLLDEDVAVGVESAIALYAIAGWMDLYVPVLANALQEEPHYVANAIMRIGPAAKPVVPVLIAFVREADDESVRHRAVLALGYIGIEDKTTVSMLVDIMKTKNGGASCNTVSALRFIGRPAVPALIETLSHSDPDLRSSAAFALGEMGREADDAVPALIQALKDEDEDVRQEVESSLQGIASDGVSSWSLPSCLSAVKRDKVLREIASAIMRSRGKNLTAGIEEALIKEALSQLPKAIDGLNSPEGEEREQAADILREMGAYAKAALPALRSHLDDEDVYVRLGTAATLLAIDGDERAALAILSDALKHPDEEVRREAARRLGNAGVTAKAALPALREAFHDHVPRVRIAVVRALAQIDHDDQTVVTLLTSLLDEHAPRLQQRQAVEILGSLGSRAKAALPVLKRFRVVEEFDRVPHEAARALRQIERAP